MRLDQQQPSPRATRVIHSRCEMDDQKYALTHSHTMTPFDAPGKQAF